MSKRGIVDLKETVPLEACYDKWQSEETLKPWKCESTCMRFYYMADTDIKLISLCKAIWPLFFLSKMAGKTYLPLWLEKMSWECYGMKAWFDNHGSHIKVKHGGEKDNEVRPKVKM